MKWRGIGFALVLSLVATAHAQPPGQLLYRGTSEYGWSHEGVQSWGGTWQVRAANEALEEIRGKIASMVNMKQLDQFTNSKASQTIDASGSYAGALATGKIAVSSSKDLASQTRWINGNNFLINVTNPRIVPGSAYTKTTNDLIKGSRWNASARFLYDYEVYGPAQGGGRGAKATGQHLPIDLDRWCKAKYGPKASAVLKSRSVTGWVCRVNGVDHPIDVAEAAALQYGKGVKIAFSNRNDPNSWYAYR